MLRSRSDKGAAAVEFALLLPLVALLIFGLIDFGRLFFVQISLTSASREAARTSSFYIEGCLPPGHPLVSGLAVSASDPCNIPPYSYISNPSVLASVRSAAEGGAADVRAMSQLKSNSALEVKLIKPCSLTPSISETEVKVSVVFDWILPFNFGSQGTYKVSSKGYMKCLN